MEKDQDSNDTELLQQPPDSEQRADKASPPVSGSIAGIERTFLRLTFWQTILSVAGVFTGAVALYAALTESQAVRQQTAATVWPYVQFMIKDGGDAESAFFHLSLENVGVGPARMRSMQLTHQGKAMPNWQSLTELLLGKEAELGTHFGKSDVSRRVLAPGDAVVAFQTDDTELALSMQEAVYSGAVELTYCYCSIFDECWRISSAKAAAENPMGPVAECPDYGARGFEN